jgi:hypothetical protein
VAHLCHQLLYDSVAILWCFVFGDYEALLCFASALLSITSVLFGGRCEQAFGFWILGEQSADVLAWSLKEA